MKQKSGAAKLKLSFFWPCRGKYSIIDLEDIYNRAVIRHSNKKYLWILSGINEIDKKFYEGILTRPKEKGFDLSKLKRRIQKYIN